MGIWDRTPTHGLLRATISPSLNTNCLHGEQTAISTSSRRSLVFQLLFTLFISGWVYFELWEATIPPLPSIPTFVAVVIGGGALGVGLVYLDTKERFRWLLEDSVTLVLIMGTALVIVFTVFPGGPPDVTEFDLVAFVWAVFAGRGYLTVTAPNVGLTNGDTSR